MMPRRKNPWDAAKSRTVIRGNHLYDPGPIEPGVKFFVLMLEQLGCTTVWSCEGHPAGFHITFRGPPEIARAIVMCGYFAVAIEDDITANGRNGYQLNLVEYENRAAYWPDRKPWDDEQRIEILRKAATAWVKYLPDVVAEIRHDSKPRVAARRRRNFQPCEDCTDPAGCRDMAMCYIETIPDDDPDPDDDVLIAEDAASAGEIVAAQTGLNVRIAPPGR
jgi:hypothetical protein